MAGLKMPGMGTETTSADRAFAAAIPDMLERGQQFQPQEWDEPDIFAEELLVWLKGEGRNASPELVQQVAEIWKQYAQMSSARLQQQQQAAGMQQQQQGQQGQGQQAPSGAPAPSAAGEADQIVQQADQQAEGQARITPTQES
jgi:hypothetical protein